MAVEARFGDVAARRSTPPPLLDSVQNEVSILTFPVTIGWISVIIALWGHFSNFTLQTFIIFQYFLVLKLMDIFQYIIIIMGGLWRMMINFLFIMTMSLALSFYIYFPVLVILYMVLLLWVEERLKIGFGVMRYWLIALQKTFCFWLDFHIVTLMLGPWQH